MLRQQVNHDWSPELQQQNYKRYYVGLSQYLKCPVQYFENCLKTVDEQQELQDLVKLHFFATLNFIANNEYGTMWDVPVEALCCVKAFNELEMEYVKYSSAYIQKVQIE